MPVSGFSSYLPTTNRFLAHWAEAEAVAPAGVSVTLAGNVSRDDLEDLRDSLETRRDAVTDAAVGRALGRETLNALIFTLQARLVEFNARVRADLGTTPFARVLPDAFSNGDAEDRVREPLRAMRALWTKINAITPVPPGLVLPLKLIGGYALATFESDMANLRLAYKTLTEEDQALKLAREVRNDAQDAIYAVLKNYRLKIPTIFAEGSAILETLPALTPAAGHTPAAVTAQGTWDAATTLAKLTWSASADAELDHYEVRGVPGVTGAKGEEYVTEDEVVLASIEPGAAREFSTDFALSVAGVSAGFKVYTVLGTGNEAGSEAVYVKRV